MLASACRISELHALSVELSFLIENPQSFNLAVNSALPTWHIEIKAFFRNPSTKFERLLRLMCLVQALNISRVHGQKSKQSLNRLSIMSHISPLKATLSRWMTAIIQDVHSILSKEDQIIHANPPSVWGACYHVDRVC